MASTTTTAGQTEEIKARKPKRYDPFRSAIRNWVAEHTMKVGTGFINPEEPITKEVTLADGSKYEISIVRTSPATELKHPFDFPRPPRKARAAKAAA